MDIERYHQYVGAIFVVTEQIGVIPKGCKLYCISQSGEYLNCATSMDVCGVNQLRLHIDHIKKLKLIQQT